MAPSHEQAHLAKAVMSYMGHISEQQHSRQDKKMARSPELRNFLLYLSKRAPSIMDKVLKSVSRKCGEALRAEKASQAARKRPAPLNHNESIAKRVKCARATKGNTAQQRGVMEGDMVDSPPAYEIEFGASTRSQSAEKTLPRTSSSEKNEDTKCDNSEESPIPKPGEKNLSNTATTSAHSKRGETLFVPTAYEIDSGLSSGSADIEDYVKASLLALKPVTTRPSFNIRSEIDKTWKIVLLLDFFKVRRELQQYLENREKMPGEKLQARTTWQISDPSKILDTLDNVKKNTIDNNIHRAYGQTILFSSINALVAGGYKSTVTGRKNDYLALLEELAREKAGPVSEAEVKQTIASYFYEYDAGQKWLAVIDWFGGSGIVLVFMAAGKF